MPSQKTNNFQHNPYQLLIPAIKELSGLDQWVCWRYQRRADKYTKVPYHPNGKPASSTDPTTWSSHADCFRAAYVDGGFDGIGYVFSGDDGYAGVDLDNCRDPETGALHDWAREIVRCLGSYTEVSPSGSGVHIICKGTIPPGANRRGKVEMYQQGRYFCVTGVVQESSPEEVVFVNGELEAVWEKHVRASESIAVSPEEIRNYQFGFELTDKAYVPFQKLEALIENDRKFKLSWNHKRPDIGDQSNSSYDLSLLTMAAIAGWNDEELYGLLVQHRLKFGGIDKAMRPDYVARCLKLAGNARDSGAKGDLEARQIAELEDAADTEGSLKAVSDQLGLDISRVIQVGTTGSTFYVVANSQKVRIGSINNLFSYSSFRNSVAEMIGKAPKPAKSDRWHRIVNLMLDCVEKETGDESVELGMTIGLIRDYLKDFPPNCDGLFGLISAGLPIIKDGLIGINTRHVMSWADRRIPWKVKVENITAAFRMMDFHCPDSGVAARDGAKTTNKRYWLGERDRLETLI